MITPVNPTPPAVVPVNAVASVAPVRRAEGVQAPATVVSVSAAAARAAGSQDSAKVATGVAQASADVNGDGTISSQEQQTDEARADLQRAMLQGGANLEEALQAYQAIASLADAQR